jgi:hypothetical protein
VYKLLGFLGKLTGRDDKTTSRARIHPKDRYALLSLVANTHQVTVI